ncbi:MAG TPA: uroporphyrinogen-III C-methyltransferase [Solirubrobacteraceae bacterium]|nr:uroporphyrinogen-III C-methyltransferase [Solirubrobacteraceae bacterium]
MNTPEGSGRPTYAEGAHQPLDGAAPDGGQPRPGEGRVYLVGAGPGDPGLLTARALELIARADTILYDRLIPAEALEGARADAELLYVGKEGGGASVPQEHTEALLVERARAGRQVVRLKGGDPFVFGRGGEEALALRAAGISFEVVPGITAGVAAPAYAGIPVTHRGMASAVALITGHEDPDKPESAIDWEALAAFPGTLVFYMGVRQLPQIAQALIAAGRPAGEPAAVVERGTLPTQRAVGGTLATIAERAQVEGVQPPSITVVGAAAELAAQLSWREGGLQFPLAGRTVAVTRARAQTSGLARRLRELGAEVVQAPAIRIRPLPGPPLDLSPYDLICFTSPNGVECLFERLAASGHRPADARALAGARVAAIGPGTARALSERGIVADVVPRRFVAEGLVEALAELPVRRALVARAKQARDALPDALRARGAEVDVVELYETVAEPLPPATLAAARAADYITFTSSSTVRFFLDAAGGRADLGPATRVVSIGPVTSATLREHGLAPHMEAERHDVEGLVAAVVADAVTE